MEKVPTLAAEVEPEEEEDEESTSPTPHQEGEYCVAFVPSVDVRHRSLHPFYLSTFPRGRFFPFLPVFFCPPNYCRNIDKLLRLCQTALLKTPAFQFATTNGPRVVPAPPPFTGHVIYGSSPDDSVNFRHVAKCLSAAMNNSSGAAQHRVWEFNRMRWFVNLVTYPKRKMAFSVAVHVARRYLCVVRSLQLIYIPPPGEPFGFQALGTIQLGSNDHFSEGLPIMNPFDVLGNPEVDEDVEWQRQKTREEAKLNRLKARLAERAKPKPPQVKTKVSTSKKFRMRRKRAAERRVREMAERKEKSAAKKLARVARLQVSITELTAAAAMRSPAVKQALAAVPRPVRDMQDTKKELIKATKNKTESAALQEILQAGLISQEHYKTALALLKSPVPPGTQSSLPLPIINSEATLNDESADAMSKTIEEKERELINKLHGIGIISDSDMDRRMKEMAAEAELSKARKRLEKEWFEIAKQQSGPLAQSLSVKHYKSKEDELSAFNIASPLTASLINGMDGHTQVHSELLAQEFHVDDTLAKSRSKEEADAELVAALCPGDKKKQKELLSTGVFGISIAELKEMDSTAPTLASQYRSLVRAESRMRAAALRSYNRHMSNIKKDLWWIS